MNYVKYEDVEYFHDMQVMVFGEVLFRIKRTGHYWTLLDDENQRIRDGRKKDVYAIGMALVNAIKKERCLV